MQTAILILRIVAAWCDINAILTLLWCMAMWRDEPAIEFGNPTTEE